MANEAGILESITKNETNLNVKHPKISGPKFEADSIEISSPGQIWRERVTFFQAGKQ